MFAFASCEMCRPHIIDKCLKVRLMLTGLNRHVESVAPHRTVMQAMAMRQLHLFHSQP